MTICKARCGRKNAADGIHAGNGDYQNLLFQDLLCVPKVACARHNQSRLIIHIERIFGRASLCLTMAVVESVASQLQSVVDFYAAGPWHDGAQIHPGGMG